MQNHIFESPPARRTDEQETCLVLEEKGGNIISNNPVIFNIRYTPYALKKGATEREIAKHKAERAFYDMSAEKNIYGYINAEKKRKRVDTAQHYFEKNYGVFNGDGYITPSQLEEMKKRAQTGEKNLWHGFISIDQKNSYKIETPEQCMTLVKKNFGQFFRDMGLDPDNVDLMCALHLDRVKHYHIHFAFWEKEPKCKYRKKDPEYRHKGTIQQSVIDNMKARLSLYITGKVQDLYDFRQRSLYQLRKLGEYYSEKHVDDEIKEEMMKLCKALPSGIRYEYGRKEMQPYRWQIDSIAVKLFLRDREASKADERVYKKFSEIRQEIKETCGENSEATAYVDKLEEDYKQRVGNIVLRAAMFIKAEHRELNPKRKYKVNDNRLKRRLAISERNVGKRFQYLFEGFATGLLELERDYSHRLQDIEEEIEEERKQQEQKVQASSKYHWSK